ncbi:actin filament-coating protein tropomyosin [Mycena olivaceomarginata]|nr:actin filament-coating protein tropomyosin [Mycena olivaceomarginata]KAJ7879238.1 actin filament-coating protein tropomyosin [Mycena olivaceomarginata]
MSDRIREKMNQLRGEVEAATKRAEEAEAKNKNLQQLLLEKEHETKSLTIKLEQLDSQLEKAEHSIADSKADRDAGESTKMTNEGLTRKIQLLEDELDAAEKNVKETVEKLRQVDVKAEHFERQVQRAEQERDMWEKKYEDAVAKFKAAEKDLADLEASMADL